jgi:hypothetical protein
MGKIILGACAVISMLSVAPAMASTRCRVTDPTGTPLNAREAPNGVITGHIRNGLLVTIVKVGPDQNGKPWVYIEDFKSGVPIGWVYREFVSCF